MAGTGKPAYAALVAGLVVMVNLILRPLVALINRQSIETTELEIRYVVRVVCRAAEEAHVRALILQGGNSGDLHLHELDSTNIEDSDRVEVLATLCAEKRCHGALEQIVGRLSLEPSVTAARWRVEAVAE